MSANSYSVIKTSNRNSTGTTQARKMVHRHVVSWMHWNALHDPKISPDVKTQVRRDVSWRTFYGNHPKNRKNDPIA
jgi:hypothetical protein